MPTTLHDPRLELLCRPAARSKLREAIETLAATTCSLTSPVEGLKRTTRLTSMAEIGRSN